METWYNCIYKRIISNLSLWEKDEQTQTLNFFLVLTCLSTGSRRLTAPFERPPTKLGHVNFNPLHLRGWCLHLLASTPQRTLVVTSLLPVVSGAEILTSACACARNFEPPILLIHFQPCYSVTTVCFIYLFYFPWADLIRYIFFY